MGRKRSGWRMARSNPWAEKGPWGAQKAPKQAVQAQHWTYPWWSHHSHNTMDTSMQGKVVATKALVSNHKSSYSRRLKCGWIRIVLCTPVLVLVMTHCSWLGGWFGRSRCGKVNRGLLQQHECLDGSSWNDAPVSSCEATGIWVRFERCAPAPLSIPRFLSDHESST
jgi:hypothetical protein